MRDIAPRGIRLLACSLIVAFTTGCTVCLAADKASLDGGLPDRTMPSQSPASVEIIPYAPIKQLSRPITHRDALSFLLPVPYPQRGVLVANGSFLGPDAGWTIVDLDARTITRLITTTETLPNGKHDAIINSKASRSLTTGELNKIIVQANAVWNPPPTPPIQPPVVTDVSCDVVLFDREDISQDSGMACPDVKLVEVIEAVKTSDVRGQ